MSPIVTKAKGQIFSRTKLEIEQKVVETVFW